MLNVVFQKYTKACTSVAGGISRLWAFDPADFNWTATTTGVAPVLVVTKYTAIARTSGATYAGGARMFSIPVIQEESFRTGKQTSRKGCGTRWEHEVTFQMPQLTGELQAYLTSLADASCCAGIGLVIEHFDGKMFVMGESVVGGTAIPPFKCYMDGTETESGKEMADFNGATVKIKGAYTRELIETTVGAAAIIALETT